MATVSLTTIEILTMLGINEVLARDITRDYMITDTKAIGHLNAEDAEGMQTACSGYANRNPAERILTVTQVK